MNLSYFPLLFFEHTPNYIILSYSSGGVLAAPPFILKGKFKMCGYDPFAWYEKELDQEHLAWLNGFDNYEDYYNSVPEDLKNKAFDRWHEEQ